MKHEEGEALNPKAEDVGPDPVWLEPPDGVAAATSDPV